jgi:hypothetical protein
MRKGRNGGEEVSLLVFVHQRCSGEFLFCGKLSPWDMVGDLVENEKEDREQIFVC